MGHVMTTPECLDLKKQLGKNLKKKDMQVFIYTYWEQIQNNLFVQENYLDSFVWFSVVCVGVAIVVAVFVIFWFIKG